MKIFIFFLFFLTTNSYSFSDLKIKKEKKNMVSFFGGLGPTHLLTVNNKKYYEEVKWEYGVVLGASLATKIDESFWIEGITLTNKTFLGGVKFEF
jgi:hypothetical protein